MRSLIIIPSLSNMADINNQQGYGANSGLET